MSQASEELASLERVAAMSEAEWRQYQFMRLEDLTRQVKWTNGKVRRHEKFIWALSGGLTVIAAGLPFVGPIVVEKI